jgi:hypothetical protein
VPANKPQATHSRSLRYEAVLLGNQRSSLHEILPARDSILSETKEIFQMFGLFTNFEALFPIEEFIKLT